MTSKHNDIIDATITLLLEKLKKKIEDGTATAAEQANFIKLLQESGYKWHVGSTPGVEPVKPSFPTFEDDEDEPIQFVR